ncbi:MAG TPA: alpha/beta hydrolase, partial [Myxococcaceae bacterium]
DERREGMLKRVRTAALEIAYEETGSSGGPAVVLLHGFPYDVRAYDGVVARLAPRCRLLVPYLRGYGQTRFLSPHALRSGQQAALGTDLLGFLDALGVDQAIVGGYDWGGRAACIVSALWPEPGPWAGLGEGVTPPQEPSPRFTVLRGHQVVSGAGHDLPQEAPDAFASAVLALL